MQSFENLWWQVLLFVPLVAVAVIVWRAMRRPGAESPRLSRFVLASVLVHAMLLFALNLWHVTVQIVELQRVLAEEELHPSYAGHQSHEPGQESWERLADLPAPEVVDSPVQRRVTEQPSPASELFDVRPEIPANLAETLPPERVLVVPRRTLVAPDVPSSQLPRMEQPLAAPELPPHPAAPPAPAAPRPEPAPEPATMAMERQTAEAPQRLPESKSEPADPPSLQPIDALKLVRERLQPVLNPAQAPERAVPATPRLELTAADAAAPPRVEQAPEPLMADPTLLLSKAATMPEPKLVAPPTELPEPTSPDRSPMPSPSRPAAQALAASTIPAPPTLPSVTRSLKPRDSVVPSVELPPRPTLGSVPESPIDLVALKLDKQVGVTLALPRTGENPLVSVPEATRTDVPSRAVERMSSVARRSAELPNPAAAARISPTAPAAASARPESPTLAAATTPDQTTTFEVPATLARSQFAGLPLKRQSGDELRGPLESDRPPLPGLLAKRATDAPLSLHPVATRVERYRAKGEPVLYARDDVGITASFTLRQQDARMELVRQLGGDEQTEAAVERGLVWLAAHQGPEGNWSLHNLYCKGHQCDATGSVQSDTAATALALLPFLGAGHTHTQGKYIETVRRGMLWLVAHQKPDGDLSVAGGQAQMYSHALATITLCELFGMSGDRILYGPTTQALRFISEAQDPNSGGWRYTPRSGGDTSVVGWQLMALKSGEMAGFHVPPQVYERAGHWLDATSSGPRRELYSYQPGSGGTPVMTAEAALSRQFLGWQRTADSMLASADYLLANPPAATARNAYYWYYATQVMFHIQGEHWSTWNARLREVLVGTQVKDGPAAGSWHPRTPSPDTYGDQGGRIYETSLALLMLEVYYRHLPLYQQLEGSSR